MTKKHATYYTDADTRQSLIDIGMKAGAKEGRAASLGLRISAAYHERLVEMVQALAYDYHLATCGEHHDPARDLLAEIQENKK